MATRTQLIAELASSHGGDVALASDMIRVFADAGADWVKLQLYDAACLADSDPQKAWLTQAQVTRPMLDMLLDVATRTGCN
jgi:sialic acid synthase SpsE